MSTKKIEGYVYENNLPAVGKNRLRDTTVTFFPEEDPNPNHTKATTLVIHSGLPEPVYTHSEVRAILHDMRSWISPDDGEEGRMWETRAKSHGIVLDPA